MRRLLLASIGLLFLGGPIAAEEPTTVPLCRTSLPCLQQMVDDLRAYREYLEDQLSLAKSLLTVANQRIVEQQKQLETLTQGKPEKH